MTREAGFYFVRRKGVDYPIAGKITVGEYISDDEDDDGPVDGYWLLIGDDCPREEEDIMVVSNKLEVISNE